MPNGCWRKSPHWHSPCSRPTAHRVRRDEPVRCASAIVPRTTCRARGDRPREVRTAVEAVEVVDREVCHVFGLGEAHVDGHTAATVVLEPQSAPADHRGARRAEVDLERGIVLAPGVSARRSVNRDAAAFVVVGPQGGVAAAERAIARGDRAGIASQCPAGLPAVARSGKDAAVPARAVHVLAAQCLGLPPAA